MDINLIRNILLLTLVFILSFCHSTNTSLIDSLTPPVILVVKSDSVIIVEGAKGERCVVNTSDKVNYRIAFLKVGDTLEIE